MSIMLAPPVKINVSLYSDGGWSNEGEILIEKLRKILKDEGW